MHVKQNRPRGMKEGFRLSIADNDYQISCPKSVSQPLQQEEANTPAMRNFKAPRCRYLARTLADYGVEKAEGLIFKSLVLRFEKRPMGYLMLSLSKRKRASRNRCLIHLCDSLYRVACQKAFIFGLAFNLSPSGSPSA